MGEMIDKLKGKAKQVEGDLRGDRTRHTEGVADEKKGDVKGGIEEVKHDIKETIRR